MSNDFRGANAGVYAFYYEKLLVDRKRDQEGLNRPHPEELKM